MNGVLKGMLIALLVVYVLSPVDLCPGPIDDIILILLSLGGRKKLLRIKGGTRNVAINERKYSKNSGYE